MKISKLIAVMFVLLLYGCATTEPVQIKTVYIQKECPVPKTKPVFDNYEMVILNINNTEWYALQKSEAIKMALNWISYKEWAEANYLLLQKKDKK